MLRFWYGIFLCACPECRERNYHSQNKAVLTEDGGVSVNYQFCKRCAEANIYMGNIYYNTWGKKTEEPVEGDAE
ncbi:hypothetical protein AAVH_24554 [Aphelenchoides avenae]|nr:hypothetical protein AAVH_24554 [Aphelenchus avenae]